MIGGPGIALTRPTVGFPGTFGNQYLAQAFGSNYFDLPAGTSVVIPPGKYLVYPGKYSWVQFFDPIIQIWVNDSTIGPHTRVVDSDGASWRVFNPLGTPVGAMMTAVGTTYVQSATTVTASAGGSTWRAIVGGAISSTITITAAAGVNYTYRPTIVIDAPPTGGVPASASCTISAGAINAVTVMNQGAGYTSVPAVRVYPNPLDPNIATITPAVLTAALASGADATGVAALLNTTPGTVLTTAPTLTITGGDSNAAATAIMALTVTGVSLSGSGGVAYPGAAINIDVNGGYIATAAGAIVNPRIGAGLFVPRKGVIYAPVSGGAAGTAVIVDGGIFQSVPTANTLATSVASAALPTTATAATLTMGSVSDRISLQPV